jgi:hypothetical protein
LKAQQKVGFMPVNPGYFQAVGLPLKKGRLLTYKDSSDDVITVVINESSARHYWGSRDPVGTFGRISRPDGSRFHVVGVIGDIRNDGIGKPTVPEIYMSPRLPSRLQASRSPRRWARHGASRASRP